MYFRTQRGGCGIDFAAAQTEFLLATHELSPIELDPMPGRMRMRFRVALPLQIELVARMAWLGYAEGLVRVERFAGEGRGRTDNARAEGKRWLVGRQRIGDDILEFAELWAADEEERLAASPHQRPFRLAYRGKVHASLGSRGERRLSPCDARFLLNLSRARDGDRVLDPFAGIGGIVAEMVARGMRAVCGDLDEALRVGLGDTSRGRACIWDAQALPLPDASLDAIVTEPPFSGWRAESVAESLPEMLRCLRPRGRLVMLVDPPLLQAIGPAIDEGGLRLERNFPVRRQGFVARALCWVRA